MAAFVHYHPDSGGKVAYEVSYFLIALLKIGRCCGMKIRTDSNTKSYDDLVFFLRAFHRYPHGMDEFQHVEAEEGFAFITLPESLSNGFGPQNNLGLPAAPCRDFRVLPLQVSAGLNA